MQYKILLVGNITEITEIKIRMLVLAPALGAPQS